MAISDLAAARLPASPSAGSPAVSHELQRQVLRISVWAALVLMLLSRVSASVIDLDIWHQMALIRQALAAGSVPQADGFAYTATLPQVVHHEWGAGVIAYLVATVCGPAGILALRYLMAAAIGVVCFRIARSRHTNPLPAFSMAAPLGILFGGNAFSPIRGHLYSLLFLAALLWLLERDRRGDRRWIALWLALSVVWINVHGGFVLGIVVLGTHGLEQCLRGQRWRHLLAAAAATLALIAATPYGFGYYPYLWQALRMTRSEIPEWYPVWHTMASFQAVAFLASVGFLLYLACRRGFGAMPGLAILCTLAAAGALHQRMLPFYAVAWTAYVPGYAAALPAGKRITRLFDQPNQWFQVAWLMVAVFFLDVTIACRPWLLEVPAEGAADAIVYPVGAVDYLSHAGFHGNLMTPFEYGAYVSWKMYPAVRVSMDSRYEAAYPGWWADRVFRLYRAQPGWQRTLTAYPTDALLVRRAQPLSRAMRRESTWRRVYADPSYELYARPGLALPTVEDAGRPLPGRFP